MSDYGLGAISSVGGLYLGKRQSDRQKKAIADQLAYQKVLIAMAKRGMPTVIPKKVTHYRVAK